MPSLELSSGLPITEEDWNQTPPSVQAFVLWQQELIVKLVKRVDELEAKFGENTGNSNRPPSTDPPYQRNNRKSKGKGKPGARAGHKGHRQSLGKPLGGWW